MPEPTDDNWQLLFDELDCWQTAGKTATFWWRDDDASRDTKQLHRLDQLSRETGVALNLAVIPALLEDSLVKSIGGLEHINILQHGYAHRSFAAPDQKKIEVGGLRHTEDIAGELILGYERLQQAFGGQFVSVLVPPWNRIDSTIYASLHGLGFCGLSSMWARQQAFPAPDLLQVNCHLDPVNWRHDRGFINQAAAIGLLQQHLSGRRNGIIDVDEPTGILTHHLDQNEAVWQFCRQLFRRLSKHPATTWLNAKTIWG